jgi:hypothetical protein
MNIGIWRPGNRSWLLRHLPEWTSNLNPITLWWSVGSQCCNDEIFIRGHCSFSSSHPTFPLANLDTYYVSLYGALTINCATGTAFYRAAQFSKCFPSSILDVIRVQSSMLSEFNPRCYPSSILDVIRVQTSMSFSEFNPRCFPSSILGVIFRVQSSMFSEFNPWCFPSSILDVFRVQSSMFSEFNPRCFSEFKPRCHFPSLNLDVILRVPTSMFSEFKSWLCIRNLNLDDIFRV